MYMNLYIYKLIHMHKVIGAYTAQGSFEDSVYSNFTMD